MTNLDSILKSRDITLPPKSPSSKAIVFPVGHVWMWELNCEESWGLKNWCFWTVVLEKTLEAPLNCKEIQPVHPKGNQSWLFIVAETPTLWPPGAKSQLTGKDPDSGKEWRWEEKGMTDDETVVWHHWLCGHEFEQALEAGAGQGSLCAWGHRVGHDEQLNWVCIPNRVHTIKARFAFLYLSPCWNISITVTLGYVLTLPATPVCWVEVTRFWE